MARIKAETAQVILYTGFLDGPRCTEGAIDHEYHHTSITIEIVGKGDQRGPYTLAPGRVNVETMGFKPLNTRGADDMVCDLEKAVEKRRQSRLYVNRDRYRLHGRKILFDSGLTRRYR